jgi:hypothetical protein
MIAWYRRIRIAAYACFAAGALLAAAAPGGTPISPVLRGGLGLLIAAFSLLLVSQAMWVILTLRRRGRTAAPDRDPAAESAP